MASSADGQRDLLAQVRESTSELYATLDPLAERLLYRLPAPGAERQTQPMVLVLGSHSAGKSTFINYLLGREVQQTGVAPTDDGFTILGAGPVDEDRDGRAAVGTPELGLSELGRFGPVLQAHLRLKIRAGCPLLERLWLVDTPGMLDAAEGSLPDGGRGYDFLGVVRWLAERADVVLLLFDPQKPGTTGETLQALTLSLSQLEHKLLIVLNKADEFRSVQDFARAYGALCWNLAKVIPRKDLPRIYTCYVPGPGRPSADGSVPVSDFDSGRDEILAEIRRAPERRVDNLITRLNDDARDVLLYARVTQDVRRECGAVRLRFRGRALGVAILGGALSGLLSFAQAGLGWGTDPVLLSLPALVGALLAILLWALGDRRAQRRGQELLSDLTQVFERLHRPALFVTEAADLRALWDRIHDPLRKALSALGPHRLPRVARRQLRAVEDILQQRIPSLRAEVYGGKGDAQASATEE